MTVLHFCLFVLALPADRYLVSRTNQYNEMYVWLIFRVYNNMILHYIIKYSKNKTNQNICLLSSRYVWLLESSMCLLYSMKYVSISTYLIKHIWSQTTYSNNLRRTEFLNFVLMSYNARKKQFTVLSLVI